MDMEHSETPKRVNTTKPQDPESAACRKRASSSKTEYIFCEQCGMFQPKDNNSGETPVKQKRMTNSSFRCRLCDRHCQNRRELYIHQMTQHGKGEPVQEFDHTLEEGNPALQEVYDANRAHILANHKRTKGGTNYNFPIQGLNDSTINKIQEHLHTIERNEDNVFKINIALGMILNNENEVNDNNTTSNDEDTQYRYYIPYTNELVMEYHLS